MLKHMCLIKVERIKHEKGFVGEVREESGLRTGENMTLEITTSCIVSLRLELDFMSNTNISFSFSYLSSIKI